MKFYKYRQNNTGGYFKFSDNLGVIVYIEAKNARHADLDAEDIGIYFDGDRWDRADDGDYYSCPVEKIDDEVLDQLTCKYSIRWGDPYIVVHYADGTKKQHIHPDKKARQ